MKNYHEASSLLSPNEIAKLDSAFDRSWSKKTCYPPQQELWSEDNKALGQCAITVLVIHDLYGGRFAYDSKNNHYWNVLPDNSQQDFSRKQFVEETVCTITEIKERTALLDTTGALKAKTPERYKMFKEKVLYSLGMIHD